MKQQRGRGIVHRPPGKTGEPLGPALAPIGEVLMADLLTLDHLNKLWPHGDQHVPSLIEGIVAAAPSVFAKYNITTPLTVAIIFGQFSEECGAGLEMVENLNYSAAGLLHTFPTHFTGTMADRYAHNPRMIADVAYGGHRGLDA
jgi:predicted chitinase